jgi:hypothetical protein
VWSVCEACFFFFWIRAAGNPVTYGRGPAEGTAWWCTSFRQSISSLVHQLHPHCTQALIGTFCSLLKLAPRSNDLEFTWIKPWKALIFEFI